MRVAADAAHDAALLGQHHGRMWRSKKVSGPICSRRMRGGHGTASAGVLVEFKLANTIIVADTLRLGDSVTITQALSAIKPKCGELYAFRNACDSGNAVSNFLAAFCAGAPRFPVH